MPGIARTGVDQAGGLIVEAVVPTVTINGSPVAVKGAQVASHGRQPHNSAIIVGGSDTVFAGGIPVCREGDTASCGHAATGSSNVNAG